MATMTLPAALHDTLLYKIVTVEMTNGLTATGRVVAFDKETMNLQMDSISHTSRRDPKSGETLSEGPPQLSALQSLTVRGGCIHSIDVSLPVVVESVARASSQAKASMS